MNPDWENLFAARKGNQKAFDLIYEKYSGRLLSMAVLIIGSLDLAKDVVQETFIRLLNAKVKDSDGNLKSYISTITYRLALKEKYRRGKLRDIDNFEFSDNSLSPLNNQIEREDQINIFNAITSLPEDQKNILILRFYGGLSYEEIAAVEKLPLGTVKSRIFYAVKAVRDKLKAMGVLE